MSPVCHHRSRVVALLGLLCVVTGVSASAQPAYVYSEPSVCTTFFKPNSGVTFHAGGEFEVTWHINFPQYGPVEYHGLPNPVISMDGAKKWTDPTANVTCFIDWYRLYPTPAWDARYRWHINYYGGPVTSCVGKQLLPDADGPYDPYNAWGDSSCSNQQGSTGGGGGGSSTCWDEYVYIEKSDDGGTTWYVIWEGWATVCA